jgi:hypothetical protein
LAEPTISHPSSSNSTAEQNPQAMLATSTTHPAFEDMWYLDNGATNHLTNELNNLDIKSKYACNRKASVGNDGKFCIKANMIVYMFFFLMFFASLFE